MRRALGTALGLGIGVLFAAGSAHATGVAFGDSVHYWPGHGNGSKDDARDAIGSPDISGGVATYDDAGFLTGITISYTGRMSPVAPGLDGTAIGSVIPGDLFLDIDADGGWDLVIRTTEGAYDPVDDPSSLSILDVAGLAPSYLFTGSDDSGHWKGFNVRHDHPYAWAGGGDEAGTAHLAAYDPTASGDHDLVFTFDDGIAVGPEMLIGFAVSCANDVILERVGNPNPVPEPATALFLGAGLVALATRRRRA